jgi:hypothetical protein
MKGVAGLVALALIKNMNINRSNLPFKYEIYNYVFELIQLYFSSDIAKYTLPVQTRYDKITNCYYKFFMESKESADVKSTKFENEVNRLNLICL